MIAAGCPGEFNFSLIQGERERGEEGVKDRKKEYGKERGGKEEEEGSRKKREAGRGGEEEER